MLWEPDCWELLKLSTLSYSSYEASRLEDETTTSSTSPVSCLLRVLSHFLLHTHKTGAPLETNLLLPSRFTPKERRLSKGAKSHSNIRVCTWRADAPQPNPHSNAQHHPGHSRWKKKAWKKKQYSHFKAPLKKKISAFSHLCELRKIFEPPVRVAVIELQSIGSVPPRVYL